MKHKDVLLLIALLICPILARPNVLEVVEEIIDDTTTEIPLTTTTPTAPSSPGIIRHESITKPSDKGGFILTTNTKVTNSKIMNIEKDDKKETIIGKAHDEGVAYENYPGHAGVAVPVSIEDYAKEVISTPERVEIKLKEESSTQKDGISTWILLSGSDPTNKPDVEETKLKVSTKPTYKRTSTSRTTTSRTTTTRRPRTTTMSTEQKKNQLMTRVKASILNENMKKKQQEQQEEEVTKKARKPSTTTTTTTEIPTTTATPTTTELTTASSTTTEAASTIATSTEYGDSEESGTYLILEAKDAEFNLPQDRSPGKTTKAPTTKKPKINNKKKKISNKKKRPEEKDEDSSLAKPGEKRPGKEKPMTTQIMNYLSREVMPTVGVGLVGLVVTAGLASYFLGSPFTALRRSDDNIRNRKDDIYFSHADDYAGPDGTNEEEMFGKLIAGMPEQSFYRNSIRYRSQSQPQPIRAGQQYGNYHVQNYTPQKYAPQIKYRNIGYSNQEAYSPYAQQVQAKSQKESVYHYTPSEGSSPIYVPSSEPTPTQPTQKQQIVLQEEPTSSTTTVTDAEPEHEELPNPAAYTGDQENTLLHRTQYVVGSVLPENINELITVPEHGPRKKRETDEKKSMEDNEISNEIEDDEGLDKTTNNNDDLLTTSKPDGTTDAPKEEQDLNTSASQNDTGLYEFIRRIVELKVRLGLSFLKNATSAFSKYLTGVQTRVDEAPLFNKPITNEKKIKLN